MVAKGFALRHGAGMSRAYKLACGCTADSKTEHYATMCAEQGVSEILCV